MVCEFTAVYEPQANGWIRAYVLEVPGSGTLGKTIEEARANLAELLRLTLNTYRVNLLSRVSNQALIEPFRIDLPALPGRVDQARAVMAGLQTRTLDQDEISQALLDEGLLEEPPPPPRSDAVADEDDDDFEPIPIEGRPISEEIIEGRR